jgi:hypothetical protein
MRAATILLLFGLLSGCFQHNAKHRRYTKLGEGAAIATGILVLSVAPTGADCRHVDQSCNDRANIAGTAGLALILGGLLGFAITTMTTPDEAPPPAPLATKPLFKPAPALK